MGRLHLLGWIAGPYILVRERLSAGEAWEARKKVHKAAKAVNRAPKDTKACAIICTASGVVLA